MIVKLIERTTGGFRNIEGVTDCSFRRLPEPVVVCNPGTPHEKTYPLVGDAFLLNDRGDTIEKFTLIPR